MKFPARVNRRVDAGVDVIADNGAELAPSGIDQFAVHFAAVVFTIVAEIGGDRAGTEIDFVADHRIAHIREVADRRMGEDDGVFDLHGLADVAVIADGGETAQITIRADLAVFPDDDISLDENPGQDPRTFSQLDMAFDDGLGMNLAFDPGANQMREMFFVRFEKIPGMNHEKRMARRQRAGQIHGIAFPCEDGSLWI